MELLLSCINSSMWFDQWKGIQINNTQRRIQNIHIWLCKQQQACWWTNTIRYRPRFICDELCLWFIVKFSHKNSKNGFPDSKVHGANMGSYGANRTQMGSMLAPWTLVSGYQCLTLFHDSLKLEHNDQAKQTTKRATAHMCLCCALLILLGLVVCNFIHIVQGYFTGKGACNCPTDKIAIVNMGESLIQSYWIMRSYWWRLYPDDLYSIPSDWPALSAPYTALEEQSWRMVITVSQQGGNISMA